MTAKIARGTQTRSRPKAKPGGRKPPPKAIDALPLPAETVRKVSLWIFAGTTSRVSTACICSRSTLSPE